MRPLVIVYVFGRMQYAPTVNCWDSVLHVAESFPALGFRPARCRKLSSLGIPSCTVQEAFQPWDSVLHDAGSFPALGFRFRPARCRELSSLGIPSCTMQGAFQPWDSAPTPWGSFRSLHFRKVSIIGGFANISAEKIGFGKRIFCFAVGLSGKNKSAGAGNGAAADSVSEFEDNIAGLVVDGAAADSVSEFEDNIAGLVVDCEKNLIQSLSY